MLLSHTVTIKNNVFLHSNPEYKDTPMDIAQLPNLPEKTSESSETSDSESESKENSGREEILVELRSNTISLRNNYIQYIEMYSLLVLLLF